MSDQNKLIGIAPSLLCADLLHLGAQIKIMDEFNPTWYHIDIMDGRFVPNFTFGPDLVKAVKSCTRTPVLAHLMCVEPENHIKLFADAGSDCIAVHIEAVVSPIRTLNQIKSFGKKAGIVINPATPVDFLPYLLEYLDFITVMSIEPGFAGQTYIDFTYNKICKIKDIVNAGKKVVPIEVDGGINLENGVKSIKCGADILVAGYFSVFKRDGSIQENYTKFINALDRAV
jgi:ribulose-phosphate 3-epimerase